MHLQEKLRNGEREREGGSTGTPTKSEKVKERYMIWRERKWKAEAGKGLVKIGLHSRRSPVSCPLKVVFHKEGDFAVNAGETCG